ncbi:homoserine kinase [Thiotrichales bacterium 19S3-7]|nr:homoserine kinase [Thiotrichales bacterium 19S3-7]MCF6802520.1 homoserine kinase [Thiotrichales bacterium 19S3-11]
MIGNQINTHIKSVTAFAPATSANFCVGFDLIGFAIADVGDTVQLIRRDDNQLRICQITGVIDDSVLSKDADKNVVSIVIKKLIKDLGLTVGFDIYLDKGITLGSGMGGSAASSVAALMAFNEFFEIPLSLEQLVNYAVYGESEVSGGAYHADNVAPSMFGGLVLLQNSKPVELIQLPTCGLYAAIINPKMSIETKRARAILNQPYPLKEITSQTAALAASIAALYRNDLTLLSQHLNDVLIEPRRKHLIKGYETVKNAALESGALACGISGSGPSMFALAQTEDDASMIAKVMQYTFECLSVSSHSWVSSLDEAGAKILKITKGS